MAKALYIKGTDKLVARISDVQFRQLTSILQKETPTDRDYYIDETVLGYMLEKGADQELVAILTKALGAVGNRDETFSSGSSRPDEGIEIDWREE